MDDITSRRLEHETEALRAAVGGVSTTVDGVIETFKGVPTEELDAELCRRGFPHGAMSSHGSLLAGIAIGALAAAQRSAADCHVVLAAIRRVTPSDAYDICAYNDVVTKLNALCVDSSEDIVITRCARMLRVAFAEVYFELEDHVFPDGEHHPPEELSRLAAVAIGFLIDVMHPACVSQAQAH